MCFTWWAVPEGAMTIAVYPITPTSGGSIKIPTSGNVYAMQTDGTVTKNGAGIAGTAGSLKLAWTPTPNLIYRQASATLWRAYDGSTWQTVAAPVLTPAQPAVALSAPSPTTLAVAITEPSDNSNVVGYKAQWRKHGTTAWTNGILSGP